MKIITNTLPAHTRVRVSRFEGNKLEGVYFWSTIGEGLSARSCWRRLTDAQHTEVFRDLPIGEYVTDHSNEVEL